MLLYCVADRDPGYLKTLADFRQQFVKIDTQEKKTRN